MVAWHHQLNRHEFERTLGRIQGQGRTGKFNAAVHRGLKSSDRTEQLN